MLSSMGLCIALIMCVFAEKHLDKSHLKRSCLPKPQRKRATHIPSPTRIRSGSTMTVRIGWCSRTSMRRSSNALSMHRCSRSGAKSASAAPTTENTICFPACWSAPTAAATFTSTSIRAIRRSSISTAPTTRATAAPAPLQLTGVEPLPPVSAPFRRFSPFSL